MAAQLVAALTAIVGAAHVHQSPEMLSCYGYDTSAVGYLPELVILPANVAEVSAIMYLANEHRFSVTPRGAGSGTTGGALPVQGGVVLVTSRMNQVLEIDVENMLCVVEPGVVNGQLQQQLATVGLFYPPDPASLAFCSLGGNVAEGAGGPSGVKYGVTKDYVAGLEAVLPTGEVVQTGARTEKSVVGYDLTRLLVGSEGTLAIFTKLILRLLPLPEAKVTYLLWPESIQVATELVTKILASGPPPCTLEYLDRTALSVVDRYLPGLLPKGVAALLLVEFDGQKTAVRERSEMFIRFLALEAVAYRIAETAETREEVWQARRSLSSASFTLRPHKINEDVVVPRTKIPKLVAFTEALAQTFALPILTFGHAGDGNIHVNIMVDKADKVEYAKGQEARKKLFEYVISLQGSLSGEHGIGLSKADVMKLEVDENSLALMRRLKSCFDPANILNPGKILYGLTEKSTQ